MTAAGKDWAVIVHGGAKQIETDEELANREGLRDAVLTAGRLLASGDSAVAAVEAAIRRLEARPVFNAGTGSVRNERGEVEMCAALMDGRGLGVGAVAALRHVHHPISVARALLPEREILLAGEGALDFAQEKGLAIPERQRQAAQPADMADHPCDTVGAVALDLRGDIAAGTSTGGLEGTRRGRVGDSPLPGCGLYADSAVGGVSLSGDGEDIARLALASRIIAAMRSGPVDAATRSAIDSIHSLGAEAGAIALDPDGNFGWAHNSPHFAVALIRSGENEPRIWLCQDEEPR